MRKQLATLAFAVGLVAVGLASIRNNFIQGSPAPEDRPSTSLKEAATSAAKKLIDDKILKKPTEEERDIRKAPLHPYQIAYTLLGVIAMGTGALAWAQKGHTRLAAGAVGLGLVAICWDWVLIAVFISVIIFVLSCLNV